MAVAPYSKQFRHPTDHRAIQPSSRPTLSQSPSEAVRRDENGKYLGRRCLHRRTARRSFAYTKV